MKFVPVILLSAALGTVIQNRANPVQDGAAFPKPADLPVQTSLPDPLVMLDGRKITSREMWFTERRPELIRLFR
jgi:hypothetical protein